MIFIIKFRRSDALPLEHKIEWLPVEAVSREDAKRIFNKFLGTPFHYPILDISVLEYER